MNHSASVSGRLLLGSLALSCWVTTVAAADLKVSLPLERTAYQTNERIDLLVTRPAPGPGQLALNLSGADGSQLSFVLPVQRASEFLHLNGWLLRPGHYAVEVAEGGSSAKTEIDLYSHVRQSSFTLINWGRAQKPEEQLPQGEDNFGYNLFYGHYGKDTEANFIRAGVDVMGVCVMSGGHQMDLRMECDWSDPYVTRGGTQRVVRKALEDRTRGNVPGVHFYDEPGLTWTGDPVTGETVPHGVPAQLRAYESAFGKPMLDYHKIDPNNPEHVAAWKHWATWKLGFMDSAWKESQFGVSYVRNDFLSATQSQYGWSAFTDGYYFNVVRCLPVISGHGGYHDFGLGLFNPSYFLEMARARDLVRPNWYLPCWYGNTTSDEFRLEQYLSFITNIQGMMSPPDMEPGRNPTGRQGIVESNHLMGRLGTIFTTMPVTPPPVAMLYSLSDLVQLQTRDMKQNYAHSTPQGHCLNFTYLAAKLLQQQFLAVTDEDVMDGTVAANHRVLILSSVNYLDPAVVKALEDFIAAGGLVLKAGECGVDVNGAVDLGVKPALPDENLDAYKNAVQAREWAKLEPYQTVAKYLQGAEPLAQAIKQQLDKVGIKPVFECDTPYIVATRQAAGDVEYLFAVNATPDASTGKRNSMKAAAASMTIEAEGRTVYDAVHGGAVAEFKPKGKALSGKFRFGPGQMRAFACTARPIGGVKAAAPTVTRQTTAAADPIRLDLAASVLDNQGAVLSGSIPLQIQVISPLGDTRYELLRATKLGALNVGVPLAANDPAGTWKVIVKELLNDTEDTATFTYQPAPKCGMLAGATRRAFMLGGEADNIHRFARVNSAVTIVKGASDFHGPAAERIQKILDPWGIRCAIVNAVDVNKPRTLTEEQAKTWCGLDYAGSGQIKPGDQNPIQWVGFAIDGPVILLGTPDDNPLIKFLAEKKFLPYTPKAGEFPGAGRGYIAWQRDGIGKGQESITLIGDDADGLAEAVGSLYEAVAGIEPLTPWTLPAAHSIAAAQKVDLPPSLATVWSVVLPDRIDSITEAKGNLSVLTHDGTLSEVSAQGKVGAPRVQQAAAEMSAVDATVITAMQKIVGPQRMVKLVATGPAVTAVAYWGGRVELRDAKNALQAARQMPQDVTALAWLGDTLVCGDADGRVIALKTK